MKKGPSKKVLGPITSALSLIVAFLIGAVVIGLNGTSPAVAYSSLIAGAFSSVRNICGTLTSATPLIFTGLGVAVAFRAGMANIGAEGQLYMGAIAAAVVGIYLPVPSWLLIPAALLAAFVAGGIIGWIPAWLKVKTNTNEVVSTLMLNYIAKLFTSWLANYPLKASGAPLGMTEDIQSAARLPVLIRGTRLNIGFILAVLIAVGIAIMFSHTTFGYEMRIQGENPTFGRYIGIHTETCLKQGMFIGGGLAGLGGSILVLGMQYKFVQGISPGYGFDGLTIALMAAFNAYAVIPIAILFGALRAGGLKMEQATGVPSELSQVIQAVVILFMAARAAFTHNMFEFLTRRNQKKMDQAEKAAGNGGET